MADFFIIFTLPPTLTMNRAQKNLCISAEIFINGERVGIRTRDPLIKSQMLYQLSYAPVIHCISQERGYVYKIKIT